MGYIVAVGGGDNGWGKTKYETKMADDEIVRLTFKKRPTLLFIGFAAKVPEDYYKIICSIYEKYQCQFLHLTKYVCEQGMAGEYIQQSDIIYVGGGNTQQLMKYIRRYKLDELLRTKYLNSNAVFAA